MAAPQCVMMKKYPGVPPKLMLKEKEELLKAFGAIAMKPVHLMSMEQVIQLLVLYSIRFYDSG